MKITIEVDVPEGKWLNLGGVRNILESVTPLIPYPTKITIEGEDA